MIGYDPFLQKELRSTYLKCNDRHPHKEEKLVVEKNGGSENLILLSFHSGL